MQVAPDRLLAGKQPLGERVVDDDDGLSMIDVLARERPAAQKSDAHRFEKATADRLPARGRQRPPFYPRAVRNQDRVSIPPNVNGRPVEAVAATTPGSAETRSRMAFCAMTAASREVYQQPAARR